MSLTALHDDHGARYRDDEPAGRRVVDHYGRPTRTHVAVRNGAGVIDTGVGVVTVRGDDRVAFVDNAISNHVPESDGRGTYALLLDPQGAIRTDMYVYAGTDRLLCLVPPTEAATLAEDWAEKTFIQDVTVEDRSATLTVFGVHGPHATEKIASVLTGASAPEPSLTFVRGSMGDAGVTVMATDAPAGEEGYEVVCETAVAADVFDTLLNRGMNAVPFGHRTWETLTIEAGTPLFATELDGQIPNVAGVRNAVDFEKGCFVGQEVVSKVENRGRPSRRLLGLRVGPASENTESVPTGGAAVFGRDADGPSDAVIGEVTRAAHSPSLEVPIALAYVDPGATPGGVRIDGDTVPVTATELPFVTGSARSARLPAYPTLESPPEDTAADTDVNGTEDRAGDRPGA